jgi:hypothetical protein
MCTSSTLQDWFLISNIAAGVAVLVAAAVAEAYVVAGKVHQHHHHQPHHRYHGIFVIPLKSNADFLEYTPLKCLYCKILISRIISRVESFV